MYPSQVGLFWLLRTNESCPTRLNLSPRWSRRSYLFMSLRLTCDRCSPHSQLGWRFGEGVDAGFVGSFDLLARVHASEGPWRFYNQNEVVVDVKVTGCARPLGMNSQTILEILRHGQLVLKALERSPIE